MKANDYMRLAKESLASRKKNTKSTVRGIAFGLIFLIPVLYIAFGIYMELTTKVNAAPEMLSLEITAADERNGFEAVASDNYYNAVISSSYTDEIGAITDGDKYYYEQLYTKRPYNNLVQGTGSYETKAFSFSVDGGTLTSYAYSSSSSSGIEYTTNTFAAVLDAERSSGMKGGQFEPVKLGKRFGSIYIDGMNKGFTGDGKGQVIVSEALLVLMGLKSADVYGHRISLEYTDGSGTRGTSVPIDDDSDTSNNDYDKANSLYGNTKEIKLFNQYEVVGVIKKEVTQAAMQTVKGYNRNSHLMNLMQNVVFLTTASRDYAPGKALEAEINFYASSNSQNMGGEGAYIATYPADFDSYNDEYLGLGSNDFTSLTEFTSYSSSGGTSTHSRYLVPTEKLFVDAADYAQLDKIVGQAAGVLSTLNSSFTRDVVAQYYATDVYSSMYMLYMIFSYVILVLGVFGGIVFFAAMVNLFNSIAHSVDSRKHYLGVMRAIGAPGGTIAKMYLAESLTIFRRAAIWIIIFAGIICTGLCILINFTFSYMNESLMAMFGIELGISWLYIPVAIAASLVMLVIIGALFSFFLSRNVAKKPITQILVD